MFGPEDFLEATNVSRETLEKFKRYAELLAEWQTKINLIGPATAGDVWGRHFYDSAQLLPLVLKSTPTLSNNVKINLAAIEMTADKVVINGIDLAGEEWANFYAFIDNPIGNLDDLTDIIEGDHEESSTRIKIFKKGTPTVVLDKVVTGSLLSPNVTVNTKEP